MYEKLIACASQSFRFSSQSAVDITKCNPKTPFITSALLFSVEKKSKGEYSTKWRISFRSREINHVMQTLVSRIQTEPPLQVRTFSLLRNIKVHFDCCHVAAR